MRSRNSLDVRRGPHVHSARSFAATIASSRIIGQGVRRDGAAALVCLTCARGRARRGSLEGPKQSLRKLFGTRRGSLPGERCDLQNLTGVKQVICQELQVSYLLVGNHTMVIRALSRVTRVHAPPQHRGGRPGARDGAARQRG